MRTQSRPTEAIPAAGLRAMTRIEDTLTRPDRQLAAKVARALGLRPDWKPNPHLGDTPTHITIWTQRELNTVYERVGGTVTTRTVQRTACDGDAVWDATEITLTVHVPGAGYVELVTDWDEPTGGRDLPVMRQIADVELIAA